MVRPSAASIGTTYWLAYLCFAVSPVFRTYHIQEKKCIKGNKGNVKLDPRKGPFNLSAAYNMAAV